MRRGWQASAELGAAPRRLQPTTFSRALSTDVSSADISSTDIALLDAALARARRARRISVGRGRRAATRTGARLVLMRVVALQRILACPHARHPHGGAGALGER